MSMKHVNAKTGSQQREILRRMYDAMPQAAIDLIEGLTTAAVFRCAMEDIDLIDFYRTMEAIRHASPVLPVRQLYAQTYQRLGMGVIKEQ